MTEQPEPRIFYAYDWLSPRKGEVWHRRAFTDKRPELGIDEPPGDEAMANEMLIVIAQRFRPDVRFRLVRVTEEIIPSEARRFHVKE